MKQDDSITLDTLIATHQSLIDQVRASIDDGPPDDAALKIPAKLVAMQADRIAAQIEALETQKAETAARIDEEIAQLREQQAALAARVAGETAAVKPVLAALEGKTHRAPAAKGTARGRKSAK